MAEKDKRDRRDERDERDERCIKNTPIGEAPNTSTLIGDLRVRLDPKGAIDDSFAKLAEQLGLDNIRINFLRSRGEPTKEVLEEFGHVTIGSLRNMLSNIENRPDLVQLVDDYITSQSCNCQECHSIR